MWEYEYNVLKPYQFHEFYNAFTMNYKIYQEMNEVNVVIKKQKAKQLG